MYTLVCLTVDNNGKRTEPSRQLLQTLRELAENLISMTPKFLLADSDPDASLPFLVHTKAPLFFALAIPKLAQASSAWEDVVDPRKIVRGLNLYPGFLTSPERLSEGQLMALIHDGAEFLLENIVGTEARQALSTECISVVWRESGTYAPKHLLADSEQGTFVIHTQFPRLIVQLNGTRGEQVIWYESCQESELLAAANAARHFRSDYLRKELAT